MFSYFTIIDEKDLAGATSYSREFLHPVPEAQKKAGSSISSEEPAFILS
jgi:hypothetical protein